MCIFYMLWICYVSDFMWNISVVRYKCIGYYLKKYFEEELVVLLEKVCLWYWVYYGIWV